MLLAFVLRSLRNPRRKQAAGARRPFTPRLTALEEPGATDDQAVGPGAVVAAGGAVANGLGGRLTVSESTFRNNVATSPAAAASGGAITNDGGSSAAVDHSTFSGNQAQGGDVA